MTVDEIKNKYAAAAAAAPAPEKDMKARENAANSMKASIPAMTRSMNEFVEKIRNGRVKASTAYKLIKKMSDLGRSMDAFK